MTRREMEMMDMNTEEWVGDLCAWVTRVPTGWLYKYYSHDEYDSQGMGHTELYHTPVFVPEADYGI